MAMSDADWKKLAVLSGNRCAFTDCLTPLVEPTTNVLIGELAHVRALTSGGPRQDPTYPPARIDSVENLMLLCPTHHTLIDKAPLAFPVAALLAMKQAHSQGAQMDDATAERIARELRAAAGPGMLAVSIGQRGGQTANVITNVGPRPRTFAGSDVGDMLAIMARMPKSGVAVVSMMNAPDGQPFGREIADLFRRAGWQAISESVEMSTQLHTGITVSVTGEGSQDVLDLANAFVARGWRTQAFNRSTLPGGSDLEVRIGLP